MKANGILLKCSLSLAFCTLVHSAVFGKSITVKNSTGSAQFFYFKVTGFPASAKQSYIALGCAFFNDKEGGPDTCKINIASGGTVDFPIDVLSLASPEIKISGGDQHWPQWPCPTTLAEFTLTSNGNDHYDISLVNGQNFNMKIEPKSISANQTINLNSKDVKSIQQMLGVFPPGCTNCTEGRGAPNWDSCPAYPSGSMPQASCKEGTEFNPNPKCQIDNAAVDPSGYTVTFLP